MTCWIDPWYTAITSAEAQKVLGMLSPDGPEISCSLLSQSVVVGDRADNSLAFHSAFDLFEVLLSKRLERQSLTHSKATALAGEIADSVADWLYNTEVADVPLLPRSAQRVLGEVYLVELPEFLPRGGHAANAASAVSTIVDITAQTVTLWNELVLTLLWITRPKELPRAA